MSNERTAFKHPNCGGVILQVVQNDSISFTCDRCGESADEIDRLIMRGLVIIRTRTNSDLVAEQKLPDKSRLEGSESGNSGSEFAK